MQINTLLRLNTAPLQQGTTPTRVLVVLNASPLPFTGVAVFHASFPIRAEQGTPPVTVWSPSADHALPARRVNETLGATDENVKRLWTFDLQFLVRDLPPNTGIGFPATFGASPESEATPEVWEEALRQQPLIAYETDCHSGDINLPFTLPLI
jgi:hypothetical protein